MTTVLWRWLGMSALLACHLGLVRAADIHMAPNGDDARNGESAAKAVATLNRAFDLVVGHPKRRTEAMRIVVGKGEYRGQTIELDEDRLGTEVTLIGDANEPEEFPVFVGDGSAATWMTVTSNRGRRTGLTVTKLQIRRYLTAFSFEANRDKPERFNAGTTIRRNVFREIGSVSLKVDDYSTAVIRFVNSRDNIVEQNYFRIIRNKTLRDCSYLHAVYAAHFSSGNRIADNTIDDICGSAIKLRDRSNRNVIEGNRFIRVQNAPAIEEWFCDKDSRKDCTKRLGECPSTGNIVARNSHKDSTNSEFVAVLGRKQMRDWCKPEDFTAKRVEEKEQ